MFMERTIEWLDARLAYVTFSGFFLQKCLIFCVCFYFFGWFSCTLFLRKTTTEYRSVDNERNKTEQVHFSQKKLQENVLLLN